MKIWLLTHSEELKKASGTGKLVKAQLGCDCEVVVWSRTEPDPSLTQLPVDNTVLVYLNNDTQPEQQKESARLAHNIIIIDSTWQQANKIYNRSPYLHRFQRYQIHDECSTYSKRRNQVENGLCTVETAIHLMKLKAHPEWHALQTAFESFNH